MKKLLLTQLVIVGLAILWCTIPALGQGITPTPWSTNFWDDASTYNGQLLEVGTVITAYDEDGVLCGIDTVTTAGNYGFMSVYGDDPDTPEDEGALGGDLISFEVNGRPATVVSGDNAFSHEITPAIRQVRLSATGTIGLSGVDMPTDKAATFNDTVRFEIGVRNDGDGLDYYGVTAVNGTISFTSLPQSASFYAAPGEIVYVYFEIVTPTFTPDTVDNITFSVYSMLDPTAEVTGNVTLFLTITDVPDDGDGNLPGRFTLYQNYPNPFNPTTTIAFSLPQATPVDLEVFDILGRQVDTRNLGGLPAGDHAVDYDASNLGSGVYFYRIVTDYSTQSRKMVLVK